MTRYDVIVLGGGIIGCAIAEELARARQSVCLLERGTVGCQASTAAAGILSAQMDLERPGPFFELCQASRRLYPSWVARLERRSRLSLGYHVDGILYLAMTSGDITRMEDRRRWQTQSGLPVERWSSQNIRRREPNVSHRVKAGFFFPTEAQVDNINLMKALVIACRRAGVTLLERTVVRRVLTRRRRVLGVQTDHARLQAPVVVNCLGSWAQSVGPPLLQVPVTPAKGQMLAFAAPRRVFRHVVMSEHAYGVQRRDGRLIVGSTVEFVGFDLRVTMEGMHTILSGFQRMGQREALHLCPFQEAWAGLRPCSADQMPVLGATPIEGLFISAGHFRHGILLAPVTAKLMAELIVKGRASCDLTSFSVNRFSAS